ncbi:MAG: DNA-directed RNA polymerase subunit beta [Chloroflexi bacterium]|nr:DNA-directed RNA polymerase subunit beta [Chloroflexota bacterium]MQC16722.1 DNA-directed RNA polymerase subunit beta [Chloroflexota bacterium]
MEMPNLIDMPRRSYERLLHEGLRELFNEISPIEDFTGGRMELRFGEYRFEEPKYSETECRDRERTYASPLRVRVELLVKESGDVKEQEIFMGDVPMMTKHGTFIINGAERVVVSQLVRSPGVYFTADVDQATGRKLTGAKLIPNRGAWLEFETSSRDVVSVKVDRKRRLPVSVLLRAIDIEDGLSEEELGTDERVIAMLGDVDDNEDHQYIASTLAKDTATNKAEALEEFYRRLRPGDPPTRENALALVETLFFDDRRYDLGVVGRYKLNKRLTIVEAPEQRTLRRADMVSIVKRIIEINNGRGSADDIDHLGNRRIRSVGELMQNQFRVGLLRMERVVRERMTITDPDEATPSALINIRPVVASMKEFFGGSQLSQFMDQVNPLSEIAHKRKLSALGPGGLSRDRAGFDVRDVHHSHYGRICPIETPEGPNIGLIGSLATFGVVNDFGFIETPYRVVQHEISKNFNRQLENRIPTEDIKSSTGKILARGGELITEETARALADAKEDTVPVMPFITDEVMLLDAHEEEKYRIAQANSKADEHGNLYESRIEVRHGEQYYVSNPIDVDYIDVSPRQIVSVAAAMIPFLEHDDANRALMGANMQRQAVPLLRPEAPLVGTGIEEAAAVDSGQVIKAEEDGEVLNASAQFLTIKYASGRVETYPLLKFVRSNQGTCINQRPVVSRGEKVRKGQPLVDSSSTDAGELALGQSILVGFMSWEGLNFEDAIILSESIVRDDKFTSIHIEKYEVEARDTKLGPEEITRDIPNVGDEALRDLDDEGIIRVGAEVREGDILVGKITPKGETELTPEEKLLRAIFGEKAREVKDTSLRVPHGERGKVIDVKVFRRENDDELPADVNMMVRVSIAQKRKITVGDKMAGRHGNKGVVSKIMAIEDMPTLEDGRPLEVILNPIGVPSRMNVGQVLETHLGWAASTLGWRAVTPVFDGATDEDITDALCLAWLAYESSAVETSAAFKSSDEYGQRVDVEALEAYLREAGYDPAETLRNSVPGTVTRAALELWLEGLGEKNVRRLTEEHLKERVQEVADRTNLAPPVWGKQVLYDGRSGERIDQPVTVGYMYMLKLIHLVDDKIHARSTGPYSLITQQPLGGKAQFGGQRFGEMEVWALEAYGAAHVLQEMLTVKSDDIVGRVKTYEAIVKGENTMEPGVPESFKVLVKELQSLGLSVEILNDDDEDVGFGDDDAEGLPRLGINLSGRETRED